eukprot:gnl/TRDRNA2_/TRDRNA2_163467_c4_seq1.p1 gnl/TRDRNA2_/TRDRNA2_163467_c4~~gnl/TRDRNA2_/TRDRNA2_163467_c4_seq1.p1  ORF type:complete len:160 (-),score=34.32 gnl/TRDRNA2_/TRDRNA2_163467_c4_seq1:255-674(-)
MATDVEWNPFQTMMLLDNLINEKVKVTAQALFKMDDLYKLSSSRNVEVLYKWITLCVSNEGGIAVVHDMPAGRGLLADFLGRNGRSIYVKPLYKNLWRLSAKPAAGITREEVSAMINKNLDFYHAVVRGFLTQLMSSTD